MSGRLAFNLLLLAAAAYFVWSATGYEPAAARIPILIGGLVLVLQAWVTVREFVAAARGVPEPSPEAEGAEAPPSPDEARRVATASAWMLFYFVLFAVLGTLTAGFLFILLFLAAQKGVRWWMALAVAGTMSAAIWLLFVKLMRFELYPGILFGGTLPSL